MRDVANVRYKPAPDALVRDGVLGWSSCTVRGLHVDALVVRRTAAGDTRVFWPERPDRHGRLHKVVWPVDPVERDSISRFVLCVLRQQGRVG